MNRILLTGGPCAGKSTALSTIKQFLMNQGWIVYTIPEASTLLQLQGGIKPSLSTLPSFQKMVTKLQHDLESSYQEYATDTQSISDNKPITILIDRGLLDGQAYIEDEDHFNRILQYALNKNESINTNSLINNQYDMILHLVTAANGAEAFYAKEAYRHETKEVAIDLDNKILEIYKHHSDRRIIPNSSTFDDKLQMIISEISDKLKIQNLSRKTLRFIVNMMDNNYGINHIVEQLQLCVPSEHPIIVTYVIKHFLKDDSSLESEEGYTFIRETNLLHIGDSNKSINEQITEIQKNKSSEMSLFPLSASYDFERIDIPEKAGSAWINNTHYMLIQSREEFGQLINESQSLTKMRYNELRRHNRDHSKHKVEKIKIFFHYKMQFYALDLFISPVSHKDSMWLKVYRTPGNKYQSNEAEVESVDVPPCIKIIKNVTKDSGYTSYSYSAE